jgi:hypothetical protein
MSRAVMLLLCAICVALLAPSVSAAGGNGSVVVIPPDAEGQLVLQWLQALLPGSGIDTDSRWGADDPPKGANKPVLKSRYGADDPPKGANKPVLKSKYGADDPPKGANKPVLKSKYGADDPPKGANKPT